MLAYWLAFKKYQTHNRSSQLSKHSMIAPFNLIFTKLKGCLKIGFTVSLQFLKFLCVITEIEVSGLADLRAACEGQRDVRE